MYEELEKILRIYANCADYFAKHGDCYGCPMPYKTEPEKGYQRECVGFETKYAALAADAITDLSIQLAEAKADYDAAVEDMALIVGDSNGALKCNACVYNPNAMGCELDGSQFDDDGECHWTFRGRQGNG